jgi:hypothetical protein
MGRGAERRGQRKAFQRHKPNTILMERLDETCKLREHRFCTRLICHTPAFERLPKVRGYLVQYVVLL